MWIISCTSVDVNTDASVRPLSGITINEPHSFGLKVTNARRQFPIDVDATGKGKRKLDDVPTPLHDGSIYSFFVVRCPYVCYMF